MLFIIFGWKTRTKEYGPTYRTNCPHCDNENYFHLLKARRWFSLFFIPVLPLSGSSYDLVCPTCNASIHLNGRAEITQAKDLHSATTAYHDGSMAEQEYKRHLNAFDTDVFNSQGGPDDVDSLTYNGASTSIVRGLFALVFGFALLTTIIGLSELNPAAFGYALFMLPYLAIRYRDKNSTTLPFAGYFQKYA